MPPTPRDQPTQVEEINEDIHLIECLMARVAALVAMTPSSVQLRPSEAQGGSSYGNATVAALRDIRRLLREERRRREAAARARGGGAEIVRLVVPSPDRVRGD